MKHLKAALERAHDKVLPLDGVHMAAVRAEDGQWPVELWGSTEKLRRQIRREMETFSVLVICMLTGLELVSYHDNPGGGWYFVGYIVTILAILIPTLFRVTQTTEQRIEKTARRAAKKDPGALKMAWGWNQELEELIRAHLESTLTPDELEVAQTLCGGNLDWGIPTPEFSGTVQELCEIARELCRERTPA